MNELIDSFSNRLSLAISIRNIKPIELSQKSGLSKSKISSYMSGRYKAKQDGIYILSQILNVDPAWLMGYNVPMERHEDDDMAISSKLDVSELTEDEIKEVKKFIEYIKNRKN